MVIGVLVEDHAGGAGLLGALGVIDELMQALGFDVSGDLEGFQLILRVA